MDTIKYKVKQIPQAAPHDCAQAGACQILEFYNIPKSLDEVKTEVPVYIDSMGKPLGSSVGHIAAYLQSQGLQTTLHTSDLQLFDLTWKNLQSSELLSHLKARAPHVRHGIYDFQAILLLIDGFEELIRRNGRIKQAIVDVQYIHNLLQGGPVYAVLNYQVLYNSPRFSYNTITKQFENDPVTGNPNTHVVVISGYTENTFTIIDPSKADEQNIPCSTLLAAYYLADLDMDSLLLSFQ